MGRGACEIYQRATMTKFGFVSTMEGASWGGSEELWSQSALRLAQREFTVYANIKSGPGQPQRIRELSQAGAKITSPYYGRSLAQKVSGRLNKPGPFNWLNHVKPDFICISDGENSGGGAWAVECATMNIPYVTISQSANDGAWSNDGAFVQGRSGFEQAAANYFVSQANLELTRKQYGIALQNGYVVRNPFSVRYEANPAWPATSPVYKIACVGRLDPGAKGQDILFDVLKMQKWRDRNLEITLFGDGPCRQSLLALKENFGLTKVTFGGFVQDVEAIWDTHHALVLPSRYEGLPLAVVEALLCGRVCIVTNVAGNAELINDNETGFVAAAPSPYFLDEALERAWQRRAEWQAIGQRAAESVRAQVPADPVDVFVKHLTALLDPRSIS